MDQKAPREPRVHRDEDWTSMPPSPHGNNKLGGHARTRDSIQPLDYFHTLGIGERTMSPPPVGLEKARGPPTDSHPDTPAASTTSDFSRSSTINSLQSQDSDITSYSLNTSSSDDTISVPRSLSFPVARNSPLNPNSLPKVDVPFDFSSLLNAYASVRAPKDWASPVPINTHFFWPEGRDEESPTRTNQALPSRHSTFPIERRRSQTKLGDASSYTSNGNEDPAEPELSGMTDQTPEAVATSFPGMHHNTMRQETLPDEADRESLSVQTDTFLKGRFSVSDGLVVGSFDRKHADLSYGFASTSSTESLHYRRRFQRYRYQRAERHAQPHINQFGVERERLFSRNGTSLCPAGGLVKTEAAVPSESTRTLEHRKEADGTREYQSPSSSPGDDCSHEETCDPCLPDSNDNTNCSDEASTPSNEDEEDLAYGKLLESITNLIFESSFVSDVEERGVPVELYVHTLLERIQNYRKPNTEVTTLCLPIRSLAKQLEINEVPLGTGEAHMRPSGQGNHGAPGGGGGGNGDTNKRLRDHEDDNDPGFTSEEDHGNNHKQTKKLKTGTSGKKYSCPFRKRNPTRFNVRDYSNCALHSFQDFALLKRHIKSCHEKAKGLFSCIRCKTTFEDQASRDDHILRPEGCKVREASRNEDPEDGITAEVSRALSARTRDANIGSWKPLWKHLFPNDNAAEIPDPEYEPPIELDEVQKHYYEEDSVHEFVQSQPVTQVLTEHPFRYIIEGLRQARGTPPEKHPKRRQDQDDRFQITVRQALERRERSILEAQQAQPAPVFAPNHWATELNGEFPFQFDLDLCSNRPYPSEQPYRSHSHYAFDGVSHDPAPSTLYSSEGTARPAPPHQPATNYPFPTVSDGRPSLAAEQSGHRSSGLSSQRSRDSGDLRTLQTEETRETDNTQYTPYSSQDPQFSQYPQYSQDPLYSQEQGVTFAHHHHQQLLHAGNARSDCQHGACNCSTFPGGKHYCANVPDQGPSELIRGVGEGTTDAFMRGDSLVILNSDEELSPSADLP